MSAFVSAPKHLSLLWPITLRLENQSVAILPKEHAQLVDNIEFK
jgi:hypothetical protein